MNATTIQVQPPRGNYSNQMSQARAFCDERSGAEASAPAAAGYSGYGGATQSAWAQPAQPHPVAVQEPAYVQQPAAVAAPSGSAMMPMGVPTLVSPNRNQDMKAFVMESGPHGDTMVQCQIQRRKNGVFEMFLRDETRNLELGQLLIAAQKKKSTTYKMSSKKDEFGKKSEHYLGKLKGAEMAGTFELVDAGMNPKKMTAWDKDDAVSGEAGGRKAIARSELASIAFSKPSDKRLPDVRAVKLNTGRKLQTIPPKAEGGKLIQDFGGRVTHVSVKNFMLEDAQAPGRTLLTFGRVGKDTFALDYAVRRRRRRRHTRCRAFLACACLRATARARATAPSSHPPPSPSTPHPALRDSLRRRRSRRCRPSASRSPPSPRCRAASGA